MLADVADEIQETVVLHPIVVVDQFGAVRRIRVKIQKTAQLRFEAGYIVGEGLLIEQVALLGLHRRVPDHTGRTAHQRDGLMSAILEMLEYHNAHHMTDVQGVGRRVDAHVRRLRPFHQFLLRPGHDVLNHTPPFELFNKILHRSIPYNNIVFFCECKDVNFNPRNQKK